LPAERLDCVKRSMPNTGLAARVLDLFENMPARTWSLSNGNRQVAGLFNWDAKQPATVRVKLDQLGLNAAGSEFIGLDYWNGQLVEIHDDTVSAELPACGSSVISITKITERPQLLGTSRHITQCFVDISEEKWRNSILSGTCKLVGGDPTELRVFTGSTRGGWKALAAEVSKDDRKNGVNVSMKDDGRLIRVSLASPRNYEVKWSIRFEKSPQN